MIGNKRRSVVSGRLNFPVKKKVVPLPNWIDKADAVVQGISGLQESMPKRRFLDLGTVPVPRPTGPRADKRQQNKKVESSRWVGSTYCLLDNQIYSGGPLGTDGSTNNLIVNNDYQQPDIVVPCDDTSRVASGMFSAPIGLRVMQQHYGARAGADVGPFAAANAYTVDASGAALVGPAAVGNVAWNSGMAMSANSANWNGSEPLSASDVLLLRNGASLNTGSMWFNQLGFQWCPIGVNHLDKNDFEKLSDFKYFRYKKFGMRITFDAPTFHKSKKNETMTSYQYAPPVLNSGFYGASNSYHGSGTQFISGNSNSSWIGDASIDRQWIDVAKTTYNATRAGPKYSCVQPYGVYDYMIIGPEKLMQLDLPALMGYSDKTNASSLGLGAVHVWDTLVEHGIPVHRAKKNYIDVSWKPYTVNLVDDPNSMGSIPQMDQTAAGPYGPTVEISGLIRTSNSQITPATVSQATTACRNALKELPIINGYPYAHIGPVVLVRFAADPGVSVAPIFETDPDSARVYQMQCRVNPIVASVPIHIKCWSTYEAYGEDFDTFNTSTLDMWKAPVFPTVFPYNSAVPNTVDPTNAG